MKVYICPDTLAELKDLETTLTGISDHQLEGASSILIRVDGPLWINLVQGGFTDPADIKHAANSALRRVPSKTLYLAPSLTWLATQPQSAILVNQFLPRCFEFSVDPPHVANISSNEALDKLRRGCLNVEVSKGLSRCTVTPPVTHHFSLPSGAHASHFIRLSELFSSMQSVDSIAYWIGTSLIEDVEGAARPPRLALLVDHASMLMLGTRVQRLLNTDAPVECLPGYPVDLESRAHVRATIELLAGTSLPLHSLIGVASTGKLKKTLNELALQADIGLTVTVLFSTSNIDGVDAIAALSVPGYQHFVSKTVCELCASGNSHPIKIQANSLLITIEKPKPISLPPQCFEPQKDFISTWGAQLGVLRVHFDDPNEATPRHHAYGIDASALLANQEFKNLVIADLKQLAPAPNLAVVPGHLSAALLSSIVKDALGIEVISDLDLKAGNSVLQRTYKNPVVLVFDDKTVSGQRLKSINDGLRRVGVAAWGTFKHVHFFCPVATPESKDAFEKLERGLTTNHDWTASFTVRYLVPLPPWHSRDKCPWCVEQAGLEKFASHTEVLDTALTGRLSHLRNGNSGDPSDSFHSPLSGEKHLKLGAGSVVAETGASQVAIAVACASAVQSLRSKRPEGLNPQGFPTPTQVASRVFTEYYTEGLIQCGILRALTPSEISDDLVSYLNQLLMDPNCEARMIPYHSELVTAFVANKLGQPDDLSPILPVLNSYGISNAALALLGYSKGGQRLASG